MKYLIVLINNLNKEICQLFRNDTFLFLFIICFISYLLFIFTGTYGTNDDLGILLKAKEGFVSDFVSYFYIKLLYFLYQINNDIPWYGIILYSLNILSIFIFIKSLIRIKNFTIFIIPFVILYLYFYSIFIINLSYTSTSIMIGANSLFAFLILLNNKNISALYVIGLGILFSLSFMVRMAGIFAVLVYIFPIIGLVFVYKYSKKQYVVIFFLPFLLLFMGDHITRTYFTSAKYQQYHEFNKLRGGLHGYPILSANINNNKILTANNWTKNDYKSFKNWNFFDERKYNITTLSNIYKYSRLKKEDKLTKYKNLYFSKIYNLFKRYKWHVYFLLLISVLIIYKFSWLTSILLIFYLLYFISITVYMEIFYRFPTRIGWPILLMNVSFLVYLIFQFESKLFQKNTYKSSFYHNGIIAIFYTLGSILIFSLPYNIQQRYSTILPFTLTFEKLQSSYKGKILYFQPARGLNLEKMNPLNNYNLELIATGTNTFSPLFYRSLEKLGVKKGYEMIPAMVNNSNAFIVGDNSFIRMLINYLKKDHNIKSKAIIVNYLPNGKKVFKLVSTSYIIGN